MIIALISLAMFATLGAVVVIVTTDWDDAIN